MIDTRTKEERERDRYRIAREQTQRKQEKERLEREKKRLEREKIYQQKEADKKEANRLKQEKQEQEREAERQKKKVKEEAKRQELQKEKEQRENERREQDYQNSLRLEQQKKALVVQQSEAETNHKLRELKAIRENEFVAGAREQAQRDHEREMALIQKQISENEIEAERLRKETNRQANEDMKGFYEDLKKDL